MFKGPYADDAIKCAKSVNAQLSPIQEISFKAATFTCLYLFRRQGQSNSLSPSFLHSFEYRSPPTADVKHFRTCLEIDSLQNIVVFIVLCLFQSLREIAIIESAGDIAMVTEAQTEYLIHIVIGGFNVLFSSHG